MRKHPGIDLYFVHLADDQLLRELRLGTIDIAVEQEYSHLPKPPEPGLDRNDLMSIRSTWRSPETSRPTRPGRTGLAPLAGMHWAAGRDQEAGECRRAAEQLCRAAGFEPEVRYQTDDGVVMLDIVAAGLAVAIIPGLAATRCPPGRAWSRYPGCTALSTRSTARPDRRRRRYSAVVGALSRPAHHIEAPDPAPPDRPPSLLAARGGHPLDEVALEGEEDDRHRDGGDQRPGQDRVPGVRLTEGTR